MSTLEKYNLAKRAWFIISPFWKSKKAKKAGICLIIALILNFIMIGLTYAFSMWAKDFFNSLQDRNYAMFIHELKVLFVLVTTVVVGSANQSYFMSKGILLWREWLSDTYAERWLQTKAFYKEIFSQLVDNPDQRIAEDLRMFPNMTVSLLFDMISSIGSLGVFSVILWRLSSSYSIFSYKIPGFLFWVAIIYVIIGSYLMHLIGRKLIPLNRSVQRLEANYRHALIRIRDKAKSLSLYNSQDYEQKALARRFDFIYDTRIRILKKIKSITYFDFAYGRLSAYIPYIVAAPKYFAGKFQIGELMQVAQGFNGVRSNLSWFIDNYSSLAEWKATLDRIVQFDMLLQEASIQSKIVYGENKDGLALKDLEIFYPDGRIMAKFKPVELAGRKKYAITGPSGIGKSTLFYALYKLWPFGQGTVNMPEGKSFFLSQIPYMPLGTLRDVLLYPRTDRKISEEEIIHILKAVELEELLPRLDETDNWEAILSVGEQQRLALARLWIEKPDWAFLDEALSGVDSERRYRILNHMTKDLPHMAIVSILHHLPENGFYDKILAWDEITENVGIS